MISALYEWFDRRYPWSRFWQEHMAGYYAPKNFNFLGADSRS